MKTFIKLSAIVAFLPCFLFGQEVPPEMAPDKNWASNISYDFNGTTIGKGVSFFNNLGMATQQQSWDALTGRVWSSEVRYDYFNRPVLQTLSAPQGSWFGYNDGFVLNSSGFVVTKSMFDAASTLFNPPAMSSQPNTLGWYYSTLNTYDPYQDITAYPYTRTIFSKLNPGQVLAVVGGNKAEVVEGSFKWLQAYSFTMPIEIGDEEDKFYETFGRGKIAKTVSRDINGVETVVFTDIDGNTVGAARSGNEEGMIETRDVHSEILDKGYVDIHIAKGCEGVVNFENVGATVSIYDLVSETLLSSTVTTSYTLSPGFYRIEDKTREYAMENSPTDPFPPIKIFYKSNYYDLSYNKYDYAGRLKKSVQPLGSLGTTPLQSTYEYNSLGQLETSTSPDEGTSKFHYCKDGQIRFSQNSEQAKMSMASYTDYDEYGRPVESGAGKLSVAFVHANDYANSLDVIPENDRGDRNFTVYDLPDADLPAKLDLCGFPAVEYIQTFVAGNVSMTYTQNPTTTKTWYSYDVYGRMRWMLQEIPGVSCITSIDYEYDPVNGQLVKTIYQKYNKSEYFSHTYQYNIAGQLTDVYTSLNNDIGTKQAHYIYNESGALKRTEIAEDLQGVDYVYNLEGQLKAINHPTLIADKDPGGDGTNGFAQDLFGMAIDYHKGDYARTNPPKAITTTEDGVNRYDGNIMGTRWNTQTASLNQKTYLYEYNKNNWIVDAAFGSTADSDLHFTENTDKDYTMDKITYDANGNLKTLARRGYTSPPGTNAMDDFVYNYKGNRLTYVKDIADNTDTSRYDDIRNQEVLTPGTPVLGTPTFNAQDNYLYNDLGQMTVDLQEGINYVYNASGLVTKINELYPVETEQMITLTFEGFPTLLYSARKYWTSGTPEVVPKIIVCDDIPATENMLCLHNSVTTNTKLRIAPNTYHKIDLDVIVDKKRWIRPEHEEPGGEIEAEELWGTSGITIVPQVIVNLRKADNTLIATQTISDQAAEYCGQFFDEHVAMTYTSGNEEYVTLELIMSSTGGGLGVPGTQRTFVDNIHVQAAANTKVAFDYNDRGQRVRKESHINSHNLINTYYVRDLSGNVMAVYQQGIGSDVGISTPYSLVEHSIYGNGRIGVYKRGFIDGGFALYELTDNLGNVRAIFKKAGSGIIALTGKTDYYPFGMPMPNLQTTDANYRYAFQGQEKDPETGMEAFELRLWDGRLGRWLTVDPAGQYFSPYLGMGNNPVSRVDPDGGSDGDPPKGLGAPGSTYFDPSDNTLFLANTSGVWEQAPISPGPTVMNNYHNFSVNEFAWTYFPVQTYLILYAASAFEIRGGTTIWGKDKSGSTGGLKGPTDDSFNYDEFVAPGADGGRLKAFAGSSSKARMFEFRNTIIVAVKDVSGGMLTGGDLGEQLDNARVDYNSTIDRRLTNFTIHTDDSTITSTFEKISLKVHPSMKKQKMDSLNRLQKSRNSTANSYLQGWKR